MEAFSVICYTKQGPHKYCGRKSMCRARKISKLNIGKCMRKYISKLHKKGGAHF